MSKKLKGQFEGITEEDRADGGDVDEYAQIDHKVVKVSPSRFAFFKIEDSVKGHEWIDKVNGRSGETGDDDQELMEGNSLTDDDAGERSNNDMQSKNYEVMPQLTIAGSVSHHSCDQFFCRFKFDDPVEADKQNNQKVAKENRTSAEF